MVRVLFLCALLAVGVHAQDARHSGVVDSNERDFVVDQVLAKLRASYIREDVARTIEADIRARQKAGNYDHLTDAGQFIEALTRDLQTTSGDKHLRVDFFADPESGHPLPSRDCLFVNIASLTGNVGYIKLDAFLPPGLCGETVAAAMTLVAGRDALILDLRDNTGGDPLMVAFMSSYFFAAPVHLEDVYERRTNVTVESWTLPFVPGPKFVGRPVFVLTSPRTFSGAEEFAYNLQMLKRAVVVGETSGGGAHPASAERIGAYFQVSVPVARYINPASRTNWEGKGVEPDIRAREALAVQTAYRAALKDVIERLTSPKERDAAQRQIDALTKVIDAAS